MLASSLRELIQSERLHLSVAITLWNQLAIAESGLSLSEG